MHQGPSNLGVQTDQDGNIPLMTSIDSGNVPLCQELLSNQPEAQIVFTKPPLKDTLLHLATRRRDETLIKLFIEAGCLVDKPNAEGQTPLHLAALNGDESALRYTYCTIIVPRYPLIQPY